MPVDVFISHSSQDKHVADAVCATLESRGIRCWIAPRDILPGEEWAEAILNAIQNSQLMLLVFSAHANESPQVRKEVERAVHHAIPIIPVRIQDVLPNKSLEYFISTPHWLDAMTPPLEKHLDHVAGTVTLVLKRQRGEAVSDSETRAVTIADDIAPRESRPNSMMTISTGAVVLTAAAAPPLVAGPAVPLIWPGGRHPATTDQKPPGPPFATHKLPTPGFKYTHVLADIQSLNEAALTETYDVTAISFAAYPALRDKYILIDCGASFGEGYGPIVVSTKSLKPAELAGKRVGVPGLKTSAYLALKLYEPDFEPVVIPFY